MGFEVLDAKCILFLYVLTEDWQTDRDWYLCHSVQSTTPPLSLSIQRNWQARVAHVPNPPTRSARPHPPLLPFSLSPTPHKSGPVPPPLHTSAASQPSQKKQVSLLLCCSASAAHLPFQIRPPHFRPYGSGGAGAGARPRAGGGQLRGRRALRAAPQPEGPRRRAAELGPHARQPLHLVPRHLRPRQPRHAPVRPPPPLPPTRCSLSLLLSPSPFESGPWLCGGKLVRLSLGLCSNRRGIPLHVR
jgi:hypothetical protein